MRFEVREDAAAVVLMMFACCVALFKWLRHATRYGGAWWDDELGGVVTLVADLPS